MLYPVPSRPYTASRKRFEHDLQVRNYSEELVFDTIGGESVIVRRVKKLHDYFTNPIFSILECPRDSGSTIYDYSGQDHDFDVLGFASDALTPAYWQTHDDYRCPNADPAEYLPALRLDGALTFTIDSGAATDFITCTKTIADTGQHFIACRFDASPGTIAVMVDDVITSDSTAIAANNSASGKITLFRDGDSGTAYAEGYAHTAALTADALSNDDLAALRDQIELWGYSLVTYENDDASGTETGEPYAIWEKKYKFPYLPYFVNIEFDYSSGYVEKIESID